MKKADIILLCVLLVLGFAGVIVFMLVSKPAVYVSVTVDGELVGTYDLSENREVLIETKSGGENRLQIRDGSAKMLSANCPNQDCVWHREITQSNESIICLPHKVAVTVVAEE